MGSSESRRIIELREWYYDDNSKEERARLLKTILYREFPSTTIENIKDYTVEKSIELNDLYVNVF